MIRRAAAAATTAAILAAPVTAQAYVRADCGVAPPAAYDTPLHARWRQRFWTGECSGLPWTCMPGEPSWNTVVDKMVAKAPAPQKSAVKAQVCRLGGLIGDEWSRAKPVRRIDTKDLQAFMREVNAAPDVTQGLNKVEQQVRARLAAPRR